MRGARAWLWLTLILTLGGCGQNPGSPSTPVVVTPLAPLAQAPLLFRKSSRSAGSPAPPKTSRLAACRLAARVVAPVTLGWVP